MKKQKNWEQLEFDFRAVDDIKYERIKKFAKTLKAEFADCLEKFSVYKRKNAHEYAYFIEYQLKFSQSKQNAQIEQKIRQQFPHSYTTSGSWLGHTFRIKE